MRITDKDLNILVKRLNNLAFGLYHIDGAYGGVSLHKNENEFGGVSDVFRCGHVSKRDLYYRIDALLIGIEIGKGLQQ